MLQQALEAAKQREQEFEKQQDAMRGEMQARVASVMDLMKTTRLSLSQKLLQSQSTCAALAQELAARDAAARCGSPQPSRVPGWIASGCILEVGDGKLLSLSCRSEAGTPRVDVLRESSSAFKGFASSPILKSNSSGRGENAAPVSTPETGSLKAPSSAKHSRSPYWFAKSQ